MKKNIRNEEQKQKITKENNQKNKIRNNKTEEINNRIAPTPHGGSVTEMNFGRCPTKVWTTEDQIFPWKYAVKRNSFVG